MTGTSSRPADAKDAYASPSYRAYAVGVLMLVYLCHGIDRTLPSLLVEPVQAEFRLSDTQLGVFGGLSYGIAFALAVAPMGYLADRVNRRGMLAVLVAVWSICTALGGLARTYAQLILSRVGVGAAEAGAPPIAIPFLADIFPPAKRGMSLGLLYAASNIGGVVASVAGGYLAAEYGWRTAMFMAGVPGLAAALLLLLTLKEPRRGGADAGPSSVDAPAAPPRTLEVLRFIGRSPAIMCLMAACAMTALVQVSIGAWASSFFIRVHHLSLAQTGLIIGLGIGLGGVVGSTVYGWLGDVLKVRHYAWPVRLVGLSLGVAFVTGMTFLFTPSIPLAIACYICGDLMRSGYPPLCYSTLMTNTEGRMRGSVMSIAQLVSYFAGFGLGPVVTGMLSDFYGGGLAIRYALASAMLIYLPAMALLLFAAPRLRGGSDSAAAQAS